MKPTKPGLYWANWKGEPRNPPRFLLRIDGEAPSLEVGWALDTDGGFVAGKPLEINVHNWAFVRPASTPTCATCKHWKFDSGTVPLEEWSNIHNAIGDCQVIPDDDFVTVELYDGTIDLAYTTADFGCTLHERRRPMKKLRRIHLKDASYANVRKAGDKCEIRVLDYTKNTEVVIHFEWHQACAIVRNIWSNYARSLIRELKEQIHSIEDDFQRRHEP